MFLGIFKRNRGFLVIFIPLITIIIWIPVFYHENFIIFNYNYYPGQFYRIFNIFSLQYPVLSKIVMILLVLSMSHLVVRLNNRYFFIHERTYLPALFYIIIVSSILTVQQINPAILSSFLLIWALFKMFNTYKKEKLCFQFFDASLLISAGSLLYFDMIFFIITIWASLIILRPRFIWREWVFTIIGILLPYVFILAVYYLLDWDIRLFTEHIISSLAFKTVLPDFLIGEKILFYTFLLLVFISSWFMIQTLYTKKIQIRKYFILFLIIFMNTILVALIFSHDNLNFVFYIAIPLSYLLTNYFEFAKESWLNKTLFFFIVIAVVYVNYEGFLMQFNK